MNITTTDHPPEEAAPPRPAALRQEVTHTLSVYVANKPGVLMRICQVFARRGYNIESLVVSQGRQGLFSRMTIGISGDPQGLEQIVKQMNKLIDVIHCQEHDDSESVVRELLLVKVLVGPEQRSAVLQVIEHFAGKTVDLTGDSLIAMIHGNSEKIDAVLGMLAAYEVVETVRTGKVVMARGGAVT